MSQGIEYMMHWAIPRISATFHIRIPEIILYAPDDGYEEWKACRRAFYDGGCSDATCLGRFAPLVSTKRLGAFWDPRASYGYAEAETALAFVQEGYEAWTGIQLFPWKGRPVVNQDRARKLAEVDERFRVCGLRIPRDIAPYVNFRPKNPDIVAFNPDLRFFRFTEVKRGGDRACEEQLQALALLHVLSGAPVAITRVVNGRAYEKPSSFVVDFVYDGPSWHVSWGGLNWFQDDA
jgi:hypothetical protein